MAGIRMKLGSTTFLRGVVLLIGLLAAALFVFVFPVGISSDDTEYYRPILVGLYAPAIPFFFALYNAHAILRLIDKNKAFSGLSVTALKNIKYCALIIGALFTAGMPYVYYAAERDDAPGVIVIGLIIIFAAVVVAVFAAVLQKLLRSAIDLKSENDLTV